MDYYSLISQVVTLFAKGVIFAFVLEFLGYRINNHKWWILMMVVAALVNIPNDILG
uniref:Uncharacterized protein n=1 Tax=viral metagenome TaxID=1070528 RepID=A0A6M3LAT2_9ZZZZ